MELLTFFFMRGFFFVLPIIKLISTIYRVQVAKRASGSKDVPAFDF